MEQRIRQVSTSNIRDMPCPEPTEGGLQAGVFGFDEYGAIIPTPDEVRAVTEEHVHELLCVLQAIDHLEQSARHWVDPVSGRTPRGSDRRTALLERLERERLSLISHYDDALAAYADGFGWEAAEALDEFVRAGRDQIRSEAPPLMQRGLF